MILQELTENEIIIQVLTTVLIGLGFIITIIIMELHTYFSSKIHKSYHKGYNKAKSDKVQYYKTIKKIIDKYSELLKEFDNIQLNGHTAFLVYEFRDYINKKYSN